MFRKLIVSVHANRAASSINVLRPHYSCSNYRYFSQNNSDGQSNRADSKVNEINEQAKTSSNKPANTESLEKEQEIQDNDPEAQIHPDWLALERRVKQHTPKPKGPNTPDGRTKPKPSAWDGENV